MGLPGEQQFSCRVELTKTGGITIVIKDSKKKEVARWNFVAGWPSKWTSAEFDASGNEVATEKISITHEGLTKA